MFNLINCPKHSWLGQLSTIRSSIVHTYVPSYQLSKAILAREMFCLKKLSMALLSKTTFHLINSPKPYQPGQSSSIQGTKVYNDIPSYQLSKAPLASAMFRLMDSRCRCTMGLEYALSGEAGSILFPRDEEALARSGLSNFWTRSISNWLDESTSWVAKSKCSIWESDRMETESVLEDLQLGMDLL